MKQTIDISIDISKIDKTALYTSPKTKKQYLSMTLLLREEKDQYGNDGFIVQKISKERKAAGERGAILGNGKIMDWDAPKKITGNDDDSDCIPF